MKIKLLTESHDENIYYWNGIDKVPKDAVNVVIDKNVGPQIKQLAFENCTDLKYVSIPEGVSTLNYGVFFGCTSLEDVEIPSTLDELRGDVFYKCTSLRSLKLPYMELIGKGSFENCTSLESLEVDFVVSVGKDAFKNCSPSLTIYTNGNDDFIKYCKRNKINCIEL